MKTLLKFGLITALSTIAYSNAVFADCRPCPHSCRTTGHDKKNCKDYKNKKGECCVELENKVSAKVTCGTDRRCTKKERKERGCKDYRNDKGEGCIEFAR